LLISASTFCFGQESISCSAFGHDYAANCNISSYQILESLAKTKSQDDLKTLIRQTNMQSLCSELSSFIICSRNQFLGISDDCDERVVLTRDVGLLALSHVLVLLEDVCTNDLQAISENLECFLDFEQRGKDAKECFNELFQTAMAKDLSGGDADHCGLYPAIVDCIVNKLDFAPGCGYGARAVASKAVGGLSEIYADACRQIDAFEKARYGGKSQPGVPSFLDWKKFF